MEKVRTVSDTKREFYTYHTRPINSIYRRVVEELMVEMHLLSVNVDFRRDPIYYLGVVTTFDKFMSGYRPEKDLESIFNALCRSVGGDSQQYRQESEALLALAQRKSTEELISWLASPIPEEGVGDWLTSVENIAHNPHFKYSRIFAVGLYTLLENSDSESVRDQKRREEVFKQVAEALHLSLEKMQKDLELYRSNLDKMTQMLSVLEETLQASRQKRDEEKDKDRPSPKSPESPESKA